MFENVTVVTVLYNAAKLIPEFAATLDSLSDNLSVVVYDSGSSDGSADAAEHLRNTTVIRGDNHGFGYGNNRCIEKVETEYTLLLNSDAAIDTRSLELLTGFLDSNPDYAGVQPLIRLWGYEKVTASCGVFLTGFGEAWDSRFMHLDLVVPDTSLDVPAITAAVSLWRTDALRKAGGFDENFFMYFEDADLSLRLGIAGWKLAVVRAAAARHLTGASSSRDRAELWELESSVRIFRKYLGNGKLSFAWWKREMRVWAYLTAHGKSFRRRLLTLRKALSLDAVGAVLPEETKAVIFGEPLNYPLLRGKIVSPTQGERLFLQQWAGLHTQEHFDEIELRAVAHTVTGVVLNADGVVLSRFCVSPKAVKTVTVAGSLSFVYIRCDSYGDRIEVRVN